MMRCARACAAACLLTVLLAAAGTAAVLLDELPAVANAAARTTNDELLRALSTALDVLNAANARLESDTLKRYTNRLAAAAQRECCDYFEALPLIKGLTHDLHGLLSMPVARHLVPVARRSYIAAVWLLQRSPHFAWNTAALRRAAAAGFMRCAYERHSAVHHQHHAGPGCDNPGRTPLVPIRAHRMLMLCCCCCCCCCSWLCCALGNGTQAV
jgi:hypothetical protein